jgi:putative phosphoesterase
VEIIIFSDLHSNPRNLDLDYIRRFDRVIFAGDFLGYLIFQPEILEIFSWENIDYILGNHDLYFLRAYDEYSFEKVFSDYQTIMIPGEEYQERYGTLHETTEILTSYDLDPFYDAHLTKKFELDGLSILACHGSPMIPFNEYLYPDSNKFDFIFKEYKFDILICGHTHIPFIKNQENRYIINPGSCTLPRGGHNPSYMTINTKPFNIRLHEIDQKLQYKKVTRNKIKLIQ